MSKKIEIQHDQPGSADFNQLVVSAINYIKEKGAQSYDLEIEMDAPYHGHVVKIEVIKSPPSATEEPHE